MKVNGKLQFTLATCRFRRDYIGRALVISIIRPMLLAAIRGVLTAMLAHWNIDPTNRLVGSLLLDLNLVSRLVAFLVGSQRRHLKLESNFRGTVASSNATSTRTADADIIV